MIFEVLCRMTVIRDAGSSVFKKLISGFHISSRSKHLCKERDRKRRMLQERVVRSRTED